MSIELKTLDFGSKSKLGQQAEPIIEYGLSHSPIPEKNFYQSQLEKFAQKVAAIFKKGQ